MEKTGIASKTDLALLKSNVTSADIESLCNSAMEHSFFSICINPYFIPLASKLLHGSQVQCGTVIGFPLGATSIESKAFETGKAIRDGATEIDMVMNISAFLSEDYSTVLNDINAVATICGKDICLKVILETCYLSTAQIQEACKLVLDTPAHFVKTSTGFGSEGASIEAVKTMSETVNGKLEVKASGGIRDLHTAQTMLQAGATRLGIGLDSGLDIIKEESP